MRTVVTHPRRGNTQSNKHSLFEMATRSMGCHGRSESVLTSRSSPHTVAHSINSGEGQTRHLPIHKPRRDKFSSKKKSLCHPPRPTVHGPSKRLTPTHGAAFGRCSILSANAHPGKLQNREIWCVHGRIRRTRDISPQGSRDQKAGMHLQGACG